MAAIKSGKNTGGVQMASIKGSGGVAVGSGQGSGIACSPKGTPGVMKGAGTSLAQAAKTKILD